MSKEQIQEVQEEVTQDVQDVQKQTPESPKAKAQREAEERKQQLVERLANSKDKFDSLKVQADFFIEMVNKYGETPETKQLAYDFMYRRYLSGEF